MSRIWLKNSLVSSVKLALINGVRRSRDIRAGVILKTALVVLLLALVVQGQARWCAEDHVAGLESEASRARVLLGSATTANPAKMTVYVTSAAIKNERGLSQRVIYVHSNYRIPGMPHESKFVTTSSAMDVTIPNLLYQVARDFTVDISNIGFVVEQGFFSDPEFGQLDFGAGDRVRVVGPDNQVRPSILISTGESAGERLVSWSQYIHTWVSEPSAIEALNRVSNQPFDTARVRFLNFVLHSKTLEKIQSSIPESNRLAFDLDVLDGQDRTNSLKQLEQQLASNPNTILFALGHIEIETGEFVVEDAAGKESLRLGIRELEMMGERYGITIFALGCKSVHNTRRGTTGTIDSIEAIERLNTAIEHSTTFGDFFLNLSSAQIRIVIDRATVDGLKINLNASIYRKRESYRKGASNGGGGGGNDNGGGKGGSRDGRPPRGGSSSPDSVLYVSFNPAKPDLRPQLLNALAPSPSPSSPSTNKADTTVSDRSFTWLMLAAILIAAIGAVIVVRRLRTSNVKEKGKQARVTSLNLNSRDASANSSGPTDSNKKADSERITNDKIIVICSHCEAGNMVFENRLSAARCGKCKQMLKGDV